VHVWSTDGARGGGTVHVWTPDGARGGVQRPWMPVCRPGVSASARYLVSCVGTCGPLGLKYHKQKYSTISFGLAHDL
jgi:hypothetical protein